MEAQIKMNSKESRQGKDLITISPTPSSTSDRDGCEDARKINIGKVMGESDDENLSGFESDSEDETRQHGNSKYLPLKLQYPSINFLIIFKPRSQVQTTIWRLVSPLLRTR